MYCNVYRTFSEWQRVNEVMRQWHKWKVVANQLCNDVIEKRFREGRLLTQYPLKSGRVSKREWINSSSIALRYVGRYHQYLYFCLHLQSRRWRGVYNKQKSWLYFFKYYLSSLISVSYLKTDESKLITQKSKRFLFCFYFC